MWIVRNNILPVKGYKLVTLWPFIFVRKDATIKEDDLNHEKIHGRQQLELLIIFFYILYVLEWLVKLVILKNTRAAYKNISFEKEAWENEDDLTYLSYRPIWAWTKYL